MASLSQGRPPGARQAQEDRGKHEQDGNENTPITKRGYLTTEAIISIVSDGLFPTMAKCPEVTAK